LILGKGATLLIHEATFGDDLQKEAINKKHSTQSEAIQAAKDMEAKFLLMFHFSQRYPKMPKLQKDSVRDFGVAFDLMRVTPYDFPFLPDFFPLLEYIFEDEEDKEEKEGEKGKTKI